MFNLRHKRTARDRQSGLVFQWRLPVSSHLSFLAALGVVGLISAGLAAVVRVRVGGPPRLPERRGSLILVPQGEEWRALEMLALEAGPLPRREEPSRDPSVRALIAEGMVAARTPGYAYQPQLRPVSVEMPAVEAPAASKGSPGVLPPLPEMQEPSQNPPLPDPARPLVLANGGIRAAAPAALAPAGLARGNRYLLGYDGAGRVTRVTTLFSAEPATDDHVELWLRQVTLEGGAKTGGWTAVEISSGS
jgi:hypothetical protein